MNDDWSDETTDKPLLTDDRSFYKVEKWAKDGTKADRLKGARDIPHRYPALAAEPIGKTAASLDAL
jgi:hypothetical protein